MPDPLTAPVVVRTNTLDPRTYRYLQLPNGLRAVLICEPEADMAAACLDVHVGQRHDPWHRQGLAHLLEHMLFMGTDRYPEEDAYRRYVQDHGGRTNAATSETHTRYHFQIAHPFLRGALDRFGQFFTAPRLDPAYVEREREAVHAEFLLKLKDEDRRFREVRRSTSNPEHSFAKFSVGDHDTLADHPGRPVVTDLRQFWEREYAAARMTLAVLGREPLNELEQLVTACFSEVPTHPTEPLPTVPPFLPEQLGVRIHVTPLAELRRLTLEFPAPPVEPHFRTRPAAYLQALLGHEGHGTLFHHLKQRGWIEALSAGTDGTDDLTLLVVRCALTEAGYEHRDEVVDLIFQYVRLIEQRGLSLDRFRERQHLLDLAFRFREPPPAGTLVQRVAEALHEVPPELAVCAPFVLDRYDEPLIRSYLGQLRPDNLRLFVQGPELPTDRVEPRYDVPWRLEPLSDAELRRWSGGPITPTLQLPDPNAYLADRLEVKPRLTPAEHPVRSLQSPAVELWHHHDPSFAVPLASVQIELFSAAARVDTHSRVLTVLLAALLTDSLEELLYPLRLAGLGVQLGATWRGLSISLQGFDDKQPAVLRDLATHLREHAPTADRFELHRARLVRQWRNTRLARPFDQVAWRLSETLRPEDFSYAEAAELLHALPFPSFARFSDAFFNELHARLLVHGNHTGSEALHLAELTGEHLLGPATPTHRGHTSVRLLRAGATLRREVPTEHDDSALSVLFQGPSTDLPTRATFLLLGQLVRTAFFSALRTDQQLGYVVHAGYQRFDHLPALRFAVQSPAHGPAALHERVQAFVRAFPDTLRTEGEPSFERVKQGLIAELSQAETRLFQRSARFARELLDGLTTFDGAAQTVAALERITLGHALASYDTHLLGPEARQVIVQCVGRAHGDGAAAQGRDDDGAWERVIERAW